MKNDSISVMISFATNKTESYKKEKKKLTNVTLSSHVVEKTKRKYTRQRVKKLKIRWSCRDRWR